MNKFIDISFDKKFTVNGKEYHTMEELPDDLRKEFLEQGIESLDDIFDQAGEKNKSISFNSNIDIPKESRMMMIRLGFMAVVAIIYYYSDFIINFFSYAN
jgi:hypothetical protein